MKKESRGKESLQDMIVMRIAINCFVKCSLLIKEITVCETAIAKVHNDILSKLDDHKNVALMLFDLSAAFDAINQGYLMQKLPF